MLSAHRFMAIFGFLLVLSEFLVAHEEFEANQKEELLFHSVHLLERDAADLCVVLVVVVPVV